MIKRDAFNVICQSDPTNPNYCDGGDSSRATGMMALVGNDPDIALLKDFELGKTGLLRRHPWQAPYNDPRSFTRDQLLQYTAGAWKNKKTDICRRVFWSRFRSGFLCQNTHTLYLTKKPWWNRDPLSPSHIGHLIKCARIQWLYALLPFCWVWLILDIIASSMTPEKENNQIIAMCSVAGTWALKLYCWLTPNWDNAMKSYWGHQLPQSQKFRYQNEIAYAIVGYVKHRITYKG